MSSFFVSASGRHVGEGRYVLQLPANISLENGSWEVSLLESEFVDIPALLGSSTMSAIFDNQKVSLSASKTYTNLEILLEDINAQLDEKKDVKRQVFVHNEELVLTADKSVLPSDAIMLSPELHRVLYNNGAIDDTLGSGAVHVLMPDLLENTSIVSGYGYCPLLGVIYADHAKLANVYQPVRVSIIPSELSYLLTNRYMQPVVGGNHMFLHFRQRFII